MISRKCFTSNQEIFMHFDRGICYMAAASDRFGANRSRGQIDQELAMDKKAMKEESERLIREALERGKVTVKQGKTRIETKCGKCGAPNRVMADPGETRVAFTCKECGQKQQTL